MGEERRSSPSVCLHDFFAQKFDGVSRIVAMSFCEPRSCQ